MFCDKATVKVKAGNGGDGLASFLHEKYKEFGGPDGGNGGNGGNVIFEASDNLNTLYYFKTHRELKAENGEKGKKRKGHGKAGQDLRIKVPRGTVVIDKSNGQPIVDMSGVLEFAIARGGKGGYGNAHFVSSTRQAPQVAELGEPGEGLEVLLELKLIADVGLIGLPNVGKSTFLSVVSAARPKIADYEFTTIVPNLGVVETGTFGAESGFIAADIPGLIEGASKGRGLGDEFLRHIERTTVLVHFLDATRSDLESDYQVIRKELKDYDQGPNFKAIWPLSKLPEIVAIGKIDATSKEDLEIKVKKIQSVTKSKVITISSVAHQNINSLIYEIESELRKVRAKREQELPTGKEVMKTFTLKDVVDDGYFAVTKEGEFFVVTGPKIEKFSIRTDFSNIHGIMRMRDILKKMGIDKELRRAGAVEGDKIKIANKEFVF